MESLEQITGAILAGGLGTRLRSLVADRPKVLAQVHGRPFLSYLLDQLAGAGIYHAVICTGHLGEQVRAAFGSSYKTLRLDYSHEPSPLGTGGALRLALPLFKSDPVLVLNGDSYCEFSLQSFLDWHLAKRSDATVVLTKVPDTSRYGRVEVDESGKIIQFAEKGTQRGSGQINAGVYILSHRLLLSIPPGKSVSLERDAFPAWLARGLYGYPSDSRFLDIGTPDSYKEAEPFFS